MYSVEHWLVTRCVYVKGVLVDTGCFGGVCFFWGVVERCLCFRGVVLVILGVH